MKLSNNFTLEEMTKSATANKLGISNIPDVEGIKKLKELCTKILQPIRDKYGHPIIVTSGYRCKKVNEAVGGAKNSQHMFAEAADIKCDDNNYLYDLIIDMIEDNNITVGQLIKYTSKTDKRKNPAILWIHVSLPGKHKNQLLHIKK